LLSRVENIQKNGEVYSGRCPIHEDNDNSFFFRGFPNGNVFGKCRKGCSNQSIMEVLRAKDAEHNSENNFVALQDNESNSLPVLSEKSLYGLAGEIVRTIEPYTEADNSALLVQLLAGFGSLIGKTAYFRMNDDYHFTKLFAVFVSSSNNDRNSCSFRQIKYLLTGVDHRFAYCLQKGLSGGEELIYQVRDRKVKRVAIQHMKDFVCYLDEVIEEEVEDKRAFIVEPEFARVLRIAQCGKNTLSSVIPQAWGSDCLQIMRKNPVKASNAHISIIGHTTKDELLKILNEAKTDNTFADCFLWVVVCRSKLVLRSRDLPDSDRNRLVEKLNKAVNFARSVKELKRDAIAQKKWIEVYQNLSREQPGLFGLITSKAEFQVMRLACLYALLDCSETIRIEHLEAALSLWQYCEDSARYIFGDQTGNKIADSIYAALLSAEDGLTKTNIRDLFHRNQKASQINKALNLLQELGRIEVEKKETAGRPIEIYQAIHSNINNKDN
jgi:Protein of unknown function (DUF3987)